MAAKEAEAVERAAERESEAVERGGEREDGEDGTVERRKLSVVVSVGDLVRCFS